MGGAGRIANQPVGEPHPRRRPPVRGSAGPPPVEVQVQALRTSGTRTVAPGRGRDLFEMREALTSSRGRLYFNAKIPPG
ncbi:hypothetical protein AFE02nite_31830 [Actinotalea fermentans]|uniref:Uncharacterized protein n=1 Tax=Actinotalea fermentans TaxID=43671 RepID=A0A511Z1X1_9CELL|nr:hypothetical protein AFE02nite_31830 [Actinotalea fermentans]